MRHKPVVEQRDALLPALVCLSIVVILDISHSCFSPQSVLECECPPCSFTAHSVERSSKYGPAACLLLQQSWHITGRALTCTAQHSMPHLRRCMQWLTKCPTVELASHRLHYLRRAAHRMAAMLPSRAPTCTFRQRTADLRKGMGTADLTVKQSRRHTSARGICSFLTSYFCKHCLIPHNGHVWREC